MITVVLAAGYATRLYPITENFPKPLLPVGNKLIINWLLDDIDTINDITEHVIVTNHKFYKHFEEWKDKQHFTKPLTIIDDGTTDNENRLGAVRDIQLATNGRNEDTLIVAGDNILDFTFQGFIKYMKYKDASCVMCHKENDLKNKQKTGIIITNKNGRIISYEEKPKNPKGNLAVPPFYCYKNKDVKRIEEALNDGCSTDAPGSFGAWLSRKIDLYGYVMPGKRYDIGDLGSYEAVKRIFDRYQ